MNQAVFNRYRGVGALFSCSLIYASFGPLVRVLSEMLGLYTQVAARMGLAFLFLALFILLFHKLHPLNKREIGLAILLGFVSTAIIIFFTFAITHIKIANTIFLLYAGSISTSLLIGTLFFKETLGKQKILALVLAFLGLYIFTAADLALGIGLGVVTALLSGISEGVGNAIRKLLTGTDKLTITLLQFFVITLTAITLIIFTHEVPVHTISTPALLALIAFAGLQLVLNYLLLYGFQNFDVNIGSVILSIELLFAALLGFFFFGEALSGLEVAGGIIIFVASAVSAWQPKITA